jgi:hypothetical protein
VRLQTIASGRVEMRRRAAHLLRWRLRVVRLLTVARGGVKVRTLRMFPTLPGSLGENPVMVSASRHG